MGQIVYIANGQITDMVVTGQEEVVNPRSEFGDLGWLAHVADTEGNVFGLWEAKT